MPTNKSIPKIKNQDKFSQWFDDAEKTAKSWGYRSKRDVAVFKMGFLRGFNVALEDVGIVKRLKKK